MTTGISAFSCVQSLCQTLKLAGNCEAWFRLKPFSAQPPRLEATKAPSDDSHGSKHHLRVDLRRPTPPHLHEALAVGRNALPMLAFCDLQLWKKRLVAFVGKAPRLEARSSSFGPRCWASGEVGSLHLLEDLPTLAMASNLLYSDGLQPNRIGLQDEIHPPLCNGGMRYISATCACKKVAYWLEFSIHARADIVGG